MKIVHMVAFILVIIGGINWGLVGLANYNLVAMIFGSMPEVEKIVYILVGVSAVYIMATHKQMCTVCGKKGK